MYKRFKNFLKEYIKKDFIQDKFDGIYPFDLNTSPCVKYKSFGEKNPDKVFYVIYRTPYDAGFFSNFASIGLHLKQIEDKGYIPVVDMQNFKTFYNNDKPVNGTENAWEYYFEQLSPYSLEEVYQSKHVLFCDGKYPFYLDCPIEERGAVFRKMFKIKKEVQEVIDTFNNYFEDEKVLGVHFRGKDMNKYPGHPFAPTPAQMFKYTDEIISKYKITKIFLATDEQKYLELYKKRYGDMVFTANSFLVDKGNQFNINPRENHRYLLGLEVLTDAILLLKCHGLLCGRSGITSVLRMMDEEFEFVYTIHNGSNSPNKYRASFLYNIKKHLPKNFGGLEDRIEIKIREKQQQVKIQEQAEE